MKICKNGYEGHVLYGLMQNKLIQYFLGKISISLVDFTESVELLNKYAYFAEKLNENKIKIKHKFKMNTIFLYKDNSIIL